MLLGENNILDNRDMLVKEITKTSVSQKSKEKSKEKILQAIENTPYITTSELSQLTGLSISGIEKNLRQLKEQNKIKRIGPDKGGHWEVVKD